MTALVATACGEFVGLDVFELIPPLAQLDYGAIRPAEPYDYWELRESFEGERHDVIGSGGVRARPEIDPEILAAFDSVTVSAGFAPFCLPGHCFRYIASILGASIETWQTAQQVAVFLGTIDTREEAILLALAHDYHWGATKETGAIRAIPQGYELVVLKTVSFCDPVQTDRFILHVLGSGRLEVAKSEVWHKESGVCI